MYKFLPKDIQNQEFKKVLRGYDSVEVDTYLEMLSEEFESMVKENKALQVKLADYQERLEGHPEESKEESIVVEPAAQPLPEIQQEDNSAELLLREAEIKAGEITSAANKELEQIRDEIEILKKQKNAFTKKIKQLLKAQFELVKILEADDRQLSELKIVERRRRKGSFTEKVNEEYEKEEQPAEIKEDTAEKILPPVPEETVPAEGTFTGSVVSEEVPEKVIPAPPEEDEIPEFPEPAEAAPGNEEVPDSESAMTRENTQFQPQVNTGEQSFLIEEESDEEEDTDAPEETEIKKIEDTTDIKTSSIQNGFNLIDRIVDDDQEDQKENNETEHNE
ncbi:MAG: DivIVA domain-containing protein [bacterium]|nr:DivIVA domain-containing protein [bacterium]